MSKKLLITLPVLTILTACGGGSIGGTNFEQLESAIQNEVLQNAPAGSVGLKAGETVKVDSLAAVFAVDFNRSEVGSSIAIEEGDLAGISLTKAASIGGKTTVTISAPGSTETVTELRGTISDILKQQSTEFTEPVAEEFLEFQNINGTDVYFLTEISNSGTKTLTQDGIGINGTQGSVEANSTLIENGDDILGAVFGVRREFEVEGEISPNYEAPTAGNFSYAGFLMLVGEEAGHISNTAAMEVNFEDLTGDFRAGGFEPDDDVSLAKSISIESALTINNTSGTISSTSGTITVDGVSGDIGVNGMLAFDNNAAAGTLIPTAEIGGISGGIFILPRTQP